MCAICSTEGPPASLAGHGPASGPGPEPAWQLWPGVRQITRQLVESRQASAPRRTRSRRRWSSSRLSRPSAKCSCSSAAKRSRSASDARRPRGPATLAPAPTPVPAGLSGVTPAHLQEHAGRCIESGPDAAGPGSRGDRPGLLLLADAETHDPLPGLGAKRGVAARGRPERPAQLSPNFTLYPDRYPVRRGPPARPEQESTGATHALPGRAGRDPQGCLGPLDNNVFVGAVV